GKVDTDDDVPAINAAKDAIVNSINDLRPILNNIKNIVDSQLGVQRDILLLLKDMHDKMMEPEPPEPDLLPPNIPDITFETPSSELPGFNHESGRREINPDISWLKQIWTVNGSAVAPKMELPFDLLYSGFHRQYIDFGVDPLASWVLGFRSVVAWAMYIVAGYWLVKILRTFEF
ncbi:MAG: hypothetical protein PHE96_11130, partial [Methylococcales bacterium]|nr:hypothetical protein [Methylococcales bacterium]